LAGTIAEIGSGVADFAVGDRVAVGWFGGNCNHCAQCRKGQFIHCVNGKVPSWHYPGGYAESATVPATALARIPSELSDAEAAPMGCAGVTTYNALRHTKALPGDRVAILGVGGLGHLGIQFARAMGFETIAINRGTAKKADALELGAHHYIDATEGDVAESLKDLGGVAVVLGTAGASQAMAATVGGIQPLGELITIGVTPEPLPISPLQLITPGLSIIGHPSGTASEIEDTMQFAVQTGVRPWIEELPLSKAAEGYAALEQGRAHYRTVLTV
jgi:D-arabinose 1-dehydrogenase-like Zn-dependent alcohol dehydrogenase